MGAIVGALYASGYSAKSLDSIFRSTNYRSSFRQLHEMQKLFMSKENSGKYALTLPFNNFKISFHQLYLVDKNIYNEFR